ncbi:MAG: ankyrin repeat domain-containing protein [Acidobacteria bacterium]|nr:ankyrin repeat domain-containing protein [Acidobacteriota bacterium]
MSSTIDLAALDNTLRRLVDVIVAGDHAIFSHLLEESPELANAGFSQGATRQGSSVNNHFIEAIGRCLYSGDTALHIAAAAYRHRMAEQLIAAGALVRAKNRRGVEPLHAAAFGSPGSPQWDPAAQSATIACLIKAGADPNAENMDGATPLHVAIRTRSASAVQTLLDHGADASLRNKNGSAAVDLALRTTGRSGSGSPEAKAQQEEILLLFKGR